MKCPVCEKELKLPEPVETNVLTYGKMVVSVTNCCGQFVQVSDDSRIKAFKYMGDRIEDDWGLKRKVITIPAKKKVDNKEEYTSEIDFLREVFEVPKNKTITEFVGPPDCWGNVARIMEDYHKDQLDKTLQNKPEMPKLDPKIIEAIMDALIWTETHEEVRADIVKLEDELKKKYC